MKDAILENPTELMIDAKVQDYIKARLINEIERLNLKYFVFSTSDFKFNELIFKELSNKLFSLENVTAGMRKIHSTILKISSLLENTAYPNHECVYLLKQTTNSEDTLTLQQKFNKESFSKKLLTVTDVKNLLKQFNTSLIENNYEEVKSYLELCCESSFILRLIREFLSIRIIEEIALHNLVIEESNEFSLLINQIMSSSLLVLLSNGENTWYLDFTDYVAYYEIFDEKENFADWVTFFNTDTKLNKCSKHALLLLAGNYYKSKKDNLKATHCYSLSLHHSELKINSIKQSINALMVVNQHAQALKLVLDEFIDFVPDDKSEKQQLRITLDTITQKYKPPNEHGHSLLMGMISNNWNFIQNKTKQPLVLIEIGSTRELTADQGSTKKLAYFCNDRNIHFITVDMDSNNTTNVKLSLRKVNDSFEAFTAKGEDFLASYEGKIDFVFLDAYDFDHGKHSEDRQKAYTEILGARINDEACHEMHLLCAKSLELKLCSWGIIVFDDVWYKNGQWNGKGTTAVPYLIKQGFEIVQSTNNAVALMRSK